MKKILVIPFLFISLILSATNYYIKNGGSDAAAGTSDGAAWETIAHVNLVSSTLKPGDIIAFKCGDTWIESVALIPHASGTSGNPITYTNYSSGARPIIESTGLFCADIDGKSYITLSGIIFNGALNSNEVVKLENGASYITVSNCLFENGWRSGLILDHTTNNCYIVNSEFASNGREPNNPSLYHGLYIEGPNNLVEYCNSHNNTGSGIHLYYGYSNTVNNNIIRYSYTHNNGETGIIITRGTGNKAYYNIISFNTGKGMRVGGDISYTELYNNTIYANGTYGILLDNNGTYNTVKNNIIYNNGTSYENNSTSTTYSNNLLTNPYFVNAGGSYLLDTDFKIPSNSAAKDAGTNVSLTQDYFGVTVPYNTVQDIGANEYEVPNPPVGPIVIYTNSVTTGTTTATTGGNVTDDGGNAVAARGVAYGSSVDPKITGSHTTDGSGTGTFISNITGLTPNTTYHVAAYATNAVTTYYGSDIEFTTTSSSGLSGDIVFDFATGKSVWVKISGIWYIVVN